MRFARKAFLRLSLIASLTACSACGGGGEGAPPEPRLPGPTAEALARMSDQVAADLARGDDCDAERHAQELRQATIDAVNEGRIPDPFQEELTSQVQVLADRIECTPPPATTEEEEEEDEDENRGENGKGKNGKGKNGGNGGRG